MSDTPDENSSGQSTGGQSQGGQQSGGQAQGGQPTGGQAPAGQGGGGQYQGQQPHYNTGPSVGDIFSKPATMSEIKIGAAASAGLGLGLGIAAFGLTLLPGSGATGSFSSSGMGSSGGSPVIMTLFMLIMLILLPLVGGYLGLRQSRVLEDQPGNLLYANAGTTGAVSALVMFVIGLVFFLLLAGPAAGDALGDLFGPGILSIIGAGISGTIAAWAGSNLGPLQGPRSQRTQQY